jgi:hypothetical protein
MIEPVAVGTMRQGCASRAGGVRYAGGRSISDMDSELAMAAQFVTDARRIVSRRHARSVKLKILGRATRDQELTLEAFDSALALLEICTQELVDSARRLGATHRKLS